MASRFAPLVLAGLLVTASAALAEDPVSQQLIIANQRFSPQTLPLASATKVKLVIHNQDALPAEFESYDLSREIVVPGHSQVTVYLGPLQPGCYRFFNDFYQAAEGWVVVSANPAAHESN